MRAVSFVCLVALFCCLSCRTSSSPPKPTKWHFSGFSEVRAYTMNWEKNSPADMIVLKDGQLNSTRNPKTGIPLNDFQIAKLRDAVHGSRPEPQAIAACFNPHHAFLFYSANGDIVGEIDICFQCGNYHGKPEGYATTWDLQAIQSIFKEMDLPIANREWK